MKWETVNLGDVLHLIIGGGTPSKSKSEYWNGDIFWCSVKDMEDDKHYLSYTKDTITKKGLENSSANLIKAGTVITSTRMGLGRAFINKVDMAINQDLKALIPNERIDNRFLLWTIVSKRKELNMLGRGSTVKGITLDILKSIEIALPPLIVQRRIADILSAYDDLIENNQKQIKLLEEAAMRLYKEWFVNLRFPGYENTKIVDGVPEGWRLGRVSELAEFKRGKTITKKNAKDGNVPVVAGGLEPAYFHNVANTVAPVITISASGANAGYTRLYNTDIWASDCSYIDASYGDKLYFIYTFLKNNKEVIDNLQRGAAQPHVYAKDINALSTYIPESTIMEPFCNLVAPLFKKIAVQERLISELKQARDKLLPKLMSGEIEV
jgi:type I restriction enzyme S subunit